MSTPELIPVTRDELEERLRRHAEGLLEGFEEIVTRALKAPTEFMTADELCRELRIDKSTLWRLEARGLPVHRPPGRGKGGMKRYKRRAVWTWMESYQSRKKA